MKKVKKNFDLKFVSNFSKYEKKFEKFFLKKLMTNRHNFIDHLV